MAHKKGGGSSTNGRDSNAQRLGVKSFAGELITGSMYAGIPHPPGYPVWTIYSWLWTVLVPWGNPAWTELITGRVGQRRDQFRPMASFVSALSSIVANGHQVVPTFPPPPLFIPYGEFSPVRLEASLVVLRPSDSVPGLV